LVAAEAVDQEVNMHILVEAEVLVVLSIDQN
jgi:hypothetical protein